MRIILSLKNIFYLFVFLCFILVSCEDREEYIPYVEVSFSVDLNINNNLATPGYSMLYPGEGFGGVIVYCEYYDYVTPDKSIFKAYDAACTLEVEDSCSIINTGNSFFGECPCCHSQYEFTNGQPVEGDAVYSLKRYKATVISNKVYVRN